MPTSIVLIDEHITDVHVKEVLSAEHLGIDHYEKLVKLDWKQVAEELKSNMGVTGRSLAGERASCEFAQRLAQYLMPDDASVDVRVLIYSQLTRSYELGGNSLFWFVPEAIRRRRQSLALDVPGFHSQWTLYGDDKLLQLW